MENVLFKISYPAEFHVQTAIEAMHKRLKAVGKLSDDIKSVHIRTQAVTVRIIDKQGPLGPVHYLCRPQVSSVLTN